METSKQEEIRSLLYILLFFLQANIYAGTSFCVWQGFTHSWTYNHRMNRLGDYIEQSGTSINTAISAHAAATGLGKDSAYFSTSYAIAAAPELNFYAGKTTFHFNGIEGREYESKKIIEYHPINGLQENEVYTAVLNGFDIISIRDADKLQRFSVSIDDPVYDSTKNLLTVIIHTTFSANCRSLECPMLSDSLNYIVDVH
jgi:hypothetical protein